MFAWIGRWVRRWIQRYIERLVCLHFCKFKEAGSDFRYVHVHVLGDNPGNVTGLGHDDRTNNNDPGHVTVSRGGNVTIGAETDATMALRRIHYLTTAHFHEGRPGHACAEGFRQIRCRCTVGGEDQESVVCYTTDAELFEGWRLAQYWDHKVGTHPHPVRGAAGITDDNPGRIACGSSLAIQAVEVERVPDCAGFGGPNDGENRLVVRARAAANAAAARVQCDGQCARTVTEAFRGWRCENNAAWAIVIVVVACADE